MGFGRSRVPPHLSGQTVVFPNFGLPYLYSYTVLCTMVTLYRSLRSEDCITAKCLLYNDDLEFEFQVRSSKFRQVEVKLRPCAGFFNYDCVSSKSFRLYTQKFLKLLYANFSFIFYYHEKFLIKTSHYVVRLNK